jgi:hypothetical protein
MPASPASATKRLPPRLAARSASSSLESSSSRPTMTGETTCWITRLLSSLGAAAGTARRRGEKAPGELNHGSPANPGCDDTAAIWDDFWLPDT